MRPLDDALRSRSCASKWVPYQITVPAGLNLRPDQQPGNRSWQLFTYGVGPYSNGIFSQSSLGAVVKMGIWVSIIAFAVVYNPCSQPFS
jgi:hypothetical protein